MNTSPLVSVLICTYNAESFIESTVLSVLNQTYPYFELLILDNNSSDKTTERIKRISEKDNRVHLFELKENLGSYRGLNFLLGKIKGVYIAINDHDDIWHPRKLEQQIQFLETHAEYVGCGSAMINWYEQYGKTFYRSQHMESVIAWHTSLVFRNNGYRYDESVKVATDFHFMKNILCENKKKIYNFEEPFVLRRVLDTKKNLSGRWMKGYSFTQLLKLSIPFVDKIALLNRMVLPQQLVDWVVIKVFNNKIPEKYRSYVEEFGVVNGLTN